MLIKAITKNKNTTNTCARQFIAHSDVVSHFLREFTADAALCQTVVCVLLERAVITGTITVGYAPPGSLVPRPQVHQVETERLLLGRTQTVCGREYVVYMGSHSSNGINSIKK